MLFALFFVTAAGAPRGGENDWLEVVKGKRFSYGPSGRDPFLFREKVEQPVVYEVGRSAMGRVGEIAREFGKQRDQREEEIDLSQPSRMVAEAMKKLEAGNYKDAENLALMAHRKLTKAHSADLRQQIDRVHRAAEFLLQRKDTEGGFRKLRLRVEAIFWNPDRPVAIISEAGETGRTYHEGDILGEDLQIHKIEKEGVVFLYKFLKVRKRLSWSFGAR